MELDGDGGGTQRLHGLLGRGAAHESLDVGPHAMTVRPLLLRRGGEGVGDLLNVVVGVGAIVPRDPPGTEDRVGRNIGLRGPSIDVDELQSAP